MVRMNTGVIAIFTATVLVFSLCRIADAGGYVGLGIGAAQSTFNRDSLPFSTDDIRPSQTGYRLFGGYQVNDYFSVEGAYDYLGKAKVSENVYGDYFEAKVTGFEVAALGFLPVGADFSVFGKGGIIFWNSDITFKSTPLGTGSRSETGNDAVAGLGIKYSFTGTYSARLEYTFYDIDKTRAGSGEFQGIWISGIFAF